jgi:hypothetical protein
METTGFGAGLVLVIDLHLLCGVRIITVDSIMADIITITIGDRFYNKG